MDASNRIGTTRSSGWRMAKTAGARTCHRLLHVSLAVLTAIAGLAPRVEAQTIRTWIQTNSGGAWLTAGNWSGSATPGATDIALFNTNPGGAGNVGINMGSADRSVGSIVVDTGRSNALNIGNSSASRIGLLTLNGNTINGVDNVILRNNSSQLLTLQRVQTGTMNVALGNTTNNVVLIDGAGGIAISSTVTGASRNLTLQGAGSGTLTLSAANTYSGTTTISAGRLFASNNTALGTSTLVVNNGGQLQLDTGITINRPATIAGSGAGNAAGAIYVANGTATYSGNLTLGADLTRLGADGVTGSTLVVSGVIDSGANPFGILIRNRQGDAGFVQLSAANTYLGNTVISIGTLRLAGGDNRLPTTTNVALGYTLAGGFSSVLELNGRNQEVAGLSIQPGTVVAGTNNIVSNTNATLSTFTVNTDLTESSFNGALTGNLKLVKAGTNSLTFTGTGTDYGSGSSFTGGVDLNAGTLILGHTNALGTGTVALNGGTIASLGTTARTFTNRVAVGGNPTFGSGTNTGALTFSGTVDLAAGVRTLTTAVSTTFSGVVTNGSITKEGAATLALSNAANSFGTLTVNAGTASIRANTAITGLGGSGGALDLAAGTLTLNQAASGTVAIPFSGSGGFTKTGVNVLTLTANSSGYAGTTTVSAGTLVANGNLGGTLSVSSGATLMGSGTVGTATITSGATLSPGNSPGVLTAADMTWAGGGNYNWQLLNATGTPGTDWDLVNGTGSLTITGSAGNPFNFNLWTLSSTGPDVNGEATGFSSTSDFTWKVASFAGGITGATGTSWYTINTSSTNGTSGFANSFTGGTFSLVQSGNDLNLVYTAPVVGASWDYTATGGSWSTAGNWSPATVPSGTATLSFSGGGGASTNDIPLDRVASLTFTGSAAGGYVISGSAISLGSGGIANNSGFTQEVAANVTLAAPVTLSSASAGVGLTLSGTLDTVGNALTVSGSGNTTLAAVSGSGGFTKAGSGTATLTGAVASPTVAVTAGGVVLGGSNLLADTTAVTVSAGTLDLGANTDTVGSFVISGGSLAGAGTLTAATYALTSGTVNANLGAGTLTANSGAATLNGTSGAGTVTVGGGSLTTGGPSVLSDAANLTLSSGGLTLGGSDTVGSFTITGGTLGGSGQTLTAATYSLGGGTVNANLGVGSSTSSAGTTTLNGTLAGNLTVAGGTVLLGSAERISASSAVSITSGSLGLGSFNDTVASFSISGGSLGGTGTLTAATYALNGGTIAANLGAGTATSSSGSTALNGTLAGDLAVAGGTVVLGAAERVGASSNVTISSGSLGLATFADTVNSFTISDGALGGSGTLTAATYALQGGTVAANLGAGTLTASSGATTLSGSSAAATVNVNSGTLALGAANRLADAANLTIAGGVLDTTASNFNDTVGTFAISSGVVNGGGTISAATYSLTGGTVNANLGAGTLNANSGAATLNGTSGATTVNIGGGTLTTGGADKLANTANVTLSSGGLTLGGNDTVGSYSQSGGTLGGSGQTLTAGTYALTGGTVNANLGGGTLTAASGNTTIAGSVAATTLTINGGTLNLTTAARLTASPAVTLSSGNLNLGGNETVGTYTQSGGTLNGPGTLTATSYSIAGGTLNTTIGSGSVSMTGGSLIGNPGQTLTNAITIGATGFGSTTTLQAWDFFGQSSPATLTATSIASGLTTGTSNNLLTRGPGAGASTGANSFRTTGFQNNGISTSNTDYFQWTVVSSSNAIQLTGIDAQFIGTTSFFAPPGVTYQYAYSTDGTNFTLIGSSGTTTTSNTVLNTDLSGVSALANIAPGTTVTFRYYASGQTTTGGWGFSSPSSGSNGLVLTGKFGSTTPASATLGISSAGATTYSGNVTVTGTAELTAAAGGTATFSGAISGATGSITKTGDGVVVLSGSNSFAGGAALNAGTLALESANALSTSGTIAFNGGTLQSSAFNTADYSARFSNAASQQYRLDTNGQNVAGTAALTSSGGSLVKLGSGTYTLTGANTYDGTTTVAAGGLQVGNGGTTGSLAGPIANDAALVFNRSNASTYAGAISGAGTIAKLGAGDLTLSGNSGGFAGTTSVSAGTLTVTGNLGGPLSVGSGATLAGTGTVGTVTVTTGATLSPGLSPGVLTTGDITWAGDGNYNWQLYDATAGAGIGWDLVSGGALTITSSSTSRFNVNLWSLSGLPNTSGTAFNFPFTTSGTYTIGTFSSITGFAADAFSINTSATNGTGGFAGYDPLVGFFTLASSGTSIDLVYTHTPPTALTWNVGSGTWSDSANWTPSDTPEGTVELAFAGAGGTATNDLVSGTGANQLTAVKGLTFSGSAGAYTLTGNVFTLGSSGTIRNDSATAQTIENGITLGGAGMIDAAGGNLVLQSGTLDTAGFTLTLQGSATTTLAAVTGTGGLVKADAGAAVLAGAVASPSIAVNAGSLSTSGANLISDSSAVTVAPGASFSLGGADTVGSVSGAGSVDVGPGLTTGGLGATDTLSGAVSGGGTFTKIGTGTTTLSGVVTTGGVTVSEGRLNMAAITAMPATGTTAAIDAGYLHISTSGTYGGPGATLLLSATQSAARVFNTLSTSTVTIASTVELGAGTTNRVEAFGTGTLTFAGNLVGTGSLIKGGAGTLVIAGTANTNSGSTEVAAGTVVVAAGSALGTGDLRMNASLASSAVLALEESVSVGNLSSGYAGSGNNVVTIASGKTLTVNQAATGTFGAPSGAQTTSITGAGGFTKAGVGTLTLAGTNGYTGPTTVSAGQLVTAAANAISTDVTVSSGATLALGAAQTFTNLAGAGTLAAGSSPVTLNVAATNTFAGTLTGNSSSLITKDGVGTMNFTGDTSGYTGGLTVNQGTITGLSFGSGTVAMNGGNAYGQNGGTIANAFTIGLSGVTSSPFVAYWNMQTASPTTVSGTGISFGSISQGNNNGTTTLLDATTASSGYSLASGTAASGSNNAGLAARVGAFSSGSSGYFEITLTGSDGFTFSLANVQLGSRSTSTGPAGYDLRSSLNSYGSSLATGTLAVNAGWSAYQAVPTGTIGSGAVTYRIYGVNGTGSPGANTANWRIDDLRLSGSTTYSAVNSVTAGLGITTAGAVSYTGNINVTGTAELTAAAGGTATFSGAISGASGAIAKTGLGTVILTGTNTYAGGVTVSAGTLVGTSDSLKGNVTNAAAVVFDQAGNGSYAGVISGVGSLAKTGAGKVTITAPQTFSGPTTISAGALALSGSGGLASPLVTVANGGLLDVTALTGGLLVGSSQTLAGTGTVAGTVVIGGGATVAPGASPGTLVVGSMEFAALGNYNWQIYDIGGGAGTGWDLLSGTGSLDITASSGSKFNVNLWSLSGLPDTSGLLAGFDQNFDYAFKIADFTGGISGFSADKFAVNTGSTNGTGGFTNELNGIFSVALGTSVAGGTANELYIVYAAVPEPSTLALAGLGLAAAGWAARRRCRTRQPA